MGITEYSSLDKGFFGQIWYYHKKGESKLLKYLW